MWIVRSFFNLLDSCPRRCLSSSSCLSDVIRCLVGVARLLMEVRPKLEHGCGKKVRSFSCCILFSALCLFLTKLCGGTHPPAYFSMKIGDKGQLAQGHVTASVTIMRGMYTAVEHGNCSAEACCFRKLRWMYASHGLTSRIN